MKDSWSSAMWSGALVLILTVLLVGTATMLNRRTNSTAGNETGGQTVMSAQPLAAQNTTAPVDGAFRGDVELAWVVYGVFSDTLTAPTTQPEDTPAATDLGSIALVLQLSQTGGAVSGYVDLTQALTFDVVHTLNDGTETGPTAAGTLTNGNVVLTSERFTTQVGNKRYTRQFQLKGAIDTNADFISGEYRETLWGYSETPYTISGTFTLQRVTVEGSSNNTGNSAPITVVDIANTAPGQTVTINVLANDSDGNGDTLTITGVSQPQFGTATVSGDGQRVIYTPNAGFVGEDQFTYFVSDGQGGTAAGTVRVTVKGANGQNQSPTANHDIATTTQGTAITIAVLTNDSDPDGDTLTVTGVGQPQNGTAAVSDNGQSVTYTPNANFVGDEQFTYTIGDGKGGTATGTVSVTVNGSNGQNRLPIANNDSVTTVQGTAITINVLTNDNDPDGDPLTVNSVGQPQNGMAAVSGNGQSVTYTPNANFVGDDQFTYTVSDDKGGTAVGTVNVRVTERNGSTDLPTIYLPLIQR